MFSSIVSVPISKSSAAFSYDSLSGSKTPTSQIEDLNLQIKSFRQYSINCLEDGSAIDILSNTGILVANIFGAFTDTQIDYTDHWFLIAEASERPFEIDEILDIASDIESKFSMSSLLLKAMKGKNLNIFTEEIINKKKELLEKIISLAKQEDINKKLYIAPLFKIYALTLNENKYEELSKKIDEVKAFFEKNERKAYYLIEKGSNAKVVEKFNNIDEIFKREKEHYHNNKINLDANLNIGKKITIKNIKDYVETLSDSYNLIDDNCQVFVRNIINHFT